MSLSSPLQGGEGEGNVLGIFRLLIEAADSFTPAVERDAGSQAVLSHMRALRRLGYAVSFAAAEEMTAEFTHDGITPCAAPFYSSVEDVLRRQAGCFDVLYLHRAEIAASYLALARRGTDAASLAALIRDLHGTRAANARAARAGVAMVRRDFSAAMVDAALRDAIAGQGEARAAARGAAAT
jgi:hypothetical protein